ncbi:ATP-dependent Clp protease adapter ClpS [Actinomyces respiraculi]|uniref:ATP-dependent Clp protease adapter ClpS n=1 Tax=Actinomyces respiraculi TaxID=2744574 RepID=UPI00141DCE8A|nr:ATP-dependent Clp protease adapter ClpS [Actinomyces respiraculi]
MCPTAPVVSPDTRQDARTVPLHLWRTVVHDDPVNTMDYVVWVFRTYFALPTALAEHRMMQVHTTGRAVVSTGPRERMEVDVAAMHSYGLRATIEPAAPDEAVQ